MDNFKRFLTFTRSERIAIVTIISLIVIILIAKYLIISNPPKRDYFKHDLDSIVARREFVMDSVQVADSIEKINKVKKEKDKRKGKDKARLVSTGHSTRTDNTCVVHNEARILTTSVDLNTADTTLLKQLPGIGSAYAKWIVSYREKLGGYCENEQLLEVYGMYSSRYEGIKDFVKIDSSFTPKKLRINADEFKILLKHPYLEYEAVKKIVNYREQKGLITSWEQLEKIVDDGVNPMLRYYVEY